MTAPAASFGGMNNLQPELRTDKNGKQTTRWVKPDSTPSTASAIPAPAVSAPPHADHAKDDKEVLDSVLKFLKSDVYTTTTMHFNAHYLSQEFPHEMRKLEQELQDGTPQLRDCWKQHLERINIQPREPESDEDHLRLFNRTRLIVQTQAAIAEHETEKQDYVGYRTAAIQTFVGDNEDDAQYLIPASLMAVWIRSGVETDYSTERFSLEYIAEMYEEIMENRYAIKERGSIDPLVIEAIIENAAPQLSSGVL